MGEDELLNHLRKIDRQKKDYRIKYNHKDPKICGYYDLQLLLNEGKTANEISRMFDVTTERVYQQVRKIKRMKEWLSKFKGGKQNGRSATKNRNGISSEGD